MRMRLCYEQQKTGNHNKIFEKEKNKKTQQNHTNSEREFKLRWVDDRSKYSNRRTHTHSHSHTDTYENGYKTQATAANCSKFIRISLANGGRRTRVSLYFIQMDSNEMPKKTKNYLRNVVRVDRRHYHCSPCFFAAIRQSRRANTMISISTLTLYALDK